MTDDFIDTGCGGEEALVAAGDGGEEAFVATGEDESSSSVLPMSLEAEAEGNGEEDDHIQGMGDHCKRCLLMIKDDQPSVICHTCVLSYHVHCLRRREREPAIPLWYCPACLCAVCRNNENGHLVVLCHTCHTGYHTYCLAPPLEEELVPDEKWSCGLCRVRLEVVRRRERWEQRRAS